MDEIGEADPSLEQYDDLSYERHSSKRPMQEECDRYHESQKGMKDWKKIGMSPNSAAENLRRVKKTYRFG